MPMKIRKNLIAILAASGMLCAAPLSLQAQEDSPSATVAAPDTTASRSGQEQSADPAALLQSGAIVSEPSFVAGTSWPRRERASLFSIGYTDLLDTYLSAEKATGVELRYTWEKTNRKCLHWSSYISHQGFFSFADTRGNSNSYIGALYNLRFGWHYNFDLAVASESPDLNIRLGGLADLTLGGLYNTRNGNNPAQARASLSVDPSVMAVWHFRVKGHPFALRYQASMPLLGIAFSPNYGQSYYEIFTRGNYDHNVVFVSPFSGVELYQRLGLDFRLWRTTFSIGYLGDIRQLDANGLKYHQYTHALFIGWRY